VDPRPRLKHSGMTFLRGGDKMRPPDLSFPPEALGEMMTLQAGCLSVSVLPAMDLLRYPLPSAIDAHRRFCYNLVRIWQ